MLNPSPLLSHANQHTQSLTKDLTKHLRDISREHNMAAMWDGEATSAPSTGSWADGQCVRNLSPAELGSGGSKYVILGWIRVAGAWLTMRTLTGN